MAGGKRRENTRRWRRGAIQESFAVILDHPLAALLCCAVIDGSGISTTPGWLVLRRWASVCAHPSKEEPHLLSFPACNQSHAQPWKLASPMPWPCRRVNLPRTRSRIPPPAYSTQHIVPVSIIPRIETQLQVCFSWHVGRSERVNRGDEAWFGAGKGLYLSHVSMEM